jgi:para-nitrobenzyl esterase
MRKLVMTVFLVIVFGLLQACSDSSDHNNPQNIEPLPPLGLEVTLDSGVVLGQEHADSDVWDWLAVPYAQPPVDELRWKAPKPVEPWEGTREATSFGNSCPQIDRVSGSAVGDEDCLHMNIWRPRTDERDLPVYVWIHGGSNIRGKNSLSNEQGDKLASYSNMVVVAIQYRLGALGWLSFEGLNTGDPLDDSGNFGLLDIISSLEWLHNNIDAFGGDPDNIVVTGNSAGAINIMSLLLSELANGLFNKAIIQSGLLLDTLEEDHNAARNMYDKMNGELNPSLDDSSEEDIAQFLRARSAYELVEAFDGRAWPFRDGHVLPEEGTALFASGDYPNKVPLIVGNTRDEYKLWTSLFNVFPNVTSDVRDAVGRYASDLWRVWGVDKFVSEIVPTPDQPNVYVYRFNWGSPNEEGISPLPDDHGYRLGAHHNLDTSFVLGNWEEWINLDATPIFFTEENAAGRQNLSESIMKYFAAFAYSGNPNGGNLPTWEPTTTGDGFSAIEFDVNSIDSSPRITVDREMFTINSVLSEISTQLEEPTKTDVVNILQGTTPAPGEFNFLPNNLSNSTR